MPLWSDPPTPRPAGRRMRDVAFRLMLGLPVRDYDKPPGPTFFRSAKAVKTRPSMNPCRDWPGWVKVAWRVYVAAGLWTLATTHGLTWWGRIAKETPPLETYLGAMDPIGKGSLALGAVWLLGAFVLLNHGKAKRREIVPNVAEFDASMAGRIKEVPIGKIAGGKWQYANFEKDPHLVVSARTGYGKTSFLTAIIVWLHIHGAKITIIDPKRTSYIALRGCDRINLHTTYDHWVTAIEAFHTGMMAYYEAVDNGEDISYWKKHFHALVIDEMGTFVEKLEDTWRHTKGAKGQHPTIRQLKEILWLGREAGYNLIVGAHQANAKVMLSTDSRAQFCNKIGLGPLEKESWTALFGYERKIRVRKKAGRGLAYTGEDFTEIQATFISMRDALALLGGSPQSTVGTEAPYAGDKGSTVHSSDSSIRDLSLNIRANDHRDEKAVAVATEMPTLVGRQAGADFCELSVAAFTKRRQNKPVPGEVKVGNKPAWTEKQLRDWLGE